MTRRTLLLALIPAALLAQGQNAVGGGTTDDAIPGLEVAGSDNGLAPTTGTTTLVIRGGGPNDQGTTPLMECRDSKCREWKPSKLSRLWRKLKVKGTK